MRSSLIRAGFVAAAATFALAACAGHGLVPSQPGFAQQSNMLAPDVKKTPPPSPCDIATTWYFKGACVAFNIKSSGGTANLKTYMGLAIVTTFGSNNAKGTQTLIMGDAFDKGDITPPTSGKEKGAPFPAYGKKCVSGTGSPAPCPGKVVNYAEVVNPNANTITLNATPKIAETYTKGFTAKEGCFPAFLLSTGAWSLKGEQLNTKPSGKKLTFPSFPIQFEFPGKTPTILATICE